MGVLIWIKRSDCSSLNIWPLIRRQKKSPSFPFLVAVSGFVHKMSDEAVANSDLKEGDRVMTLVGGGGYAGMHVSVV